MATNNQTKLDVVRKAVLENVLPDVPFDGWTRDGMRRAAEKAGYDLAMLRMAFPDGEVDLIGYFFGLQDKELIEKLDAIDLTELRIRDRIKTAVRMRIEIMEPHREAARRATTMLALPMYASYGAKSLYRTVDAIWFGIGDQSTDFNFYTKRAILAGVFTSTIAVWFSETTGSSEKTWRFLDRRIDDVMQIEKVKARVRNATESLPSPLGIIGRLARGRTA